MRILTWMKVILRGIMEFGIVVAFALLGYSIGENTFMKIILSSMLPIVIFSFWGFFNFRKVAKNQELFRLFQELLICSIAILAFKISGHQIVAIVMSIITIAHYILVYSLGHRLIKN
ncbi:DUF2568 domain-containing protein [Clostridium sp. 'White wine YQ']|uniref:DUF2568 domain-containing protein n=1 Tax=Clostridium sp. 'White wine YQ' TaxID=3027474 RepID=UPI0023659CC2|nr:DUF2568 domain-containing protein [Clostridium sp. 'White wine YQ']MDD7794412.1 DUF2568 domain-containing protein [Clostridium sp. 'White wine YQ']